MDSCVCEKAVTTTQLAHRGVDLYKILGGKWKTCPPPQVSLDSLQATHMSNSQTLYVYITVRNVFLTTSIQCNLDLET